ncbi:MAG: PLP-dependent aspartate aminotransferase family protein [Proteobacteria bacterium]|nr:PLP-dependent aspartate aminotransferase family protein [Pseudomonadota bacterium]
MKKETLLAQSGSRWDFRTGSVSMPIYQVATFRHPALGESTGFDYSRSGNPTRSVLETTIAELEGGSRGLAFSSGMSAIDCLMRIFKPNSHIIVTEDLYGGTYRLFEQYKDYGIDFSYVDTTSPEEVKSALKKNTVALFIETPTNPILKVADIEELGKFCKENNLLFIVDNTFLTFYYQKPLELGADIVVYSASKYLSGHNDVIGGILVTKDQELGERLYFFQNSIGGIMSPFDSWLVLRGLKTLHLRLERQTANAEKIANWLENNDSVTKVYYPGLKSSPWYNVLIKQSGGAGAMISFEIKYPDRVPKILAEVKTFLFAESLGGVESLITFPSVQTHSAMPEDLRKKLGINDRLLRLSIGVENYEDLIEDLERVLK